MAKSSKVKVVKEKEVLVNTGVLMQDVFTATDIITPESSGVDTTVTLPPSVHLNLEIKPVEEKTEEQKIVDYIANSHSDRIELAPILRSLYPVVSFAEPAKYLQQSESKRLKGLLAKMKSDGLITLESDSYLKLGQFYYDHETKTRHWDINKVKIVAIK